MDYYSLDVILMLIIIVLPLYANIKINSTYSKYSKKQNSGKLTGKEVAEKILEMNELSNVKVGRINGSLTDHYDPRNKTISLSDGIYNSDSISACAVAAHEVGHAIQDKERYSMLVFRSKLVPVVNFTSRLSSILVFSGFIFDLFNFITIGAILLTVGLFFQLITLPVEFDASKRAKEELQKCGLIEKQDTKGATKVLKAAAFTYVAGFLASALQIARLLLISRNRD
ncbi:MAG: zinc metallopeptidase [Bacillales bacterium]|nr:zinc metallopeptidase [Bacillales bacterium]MCI7559156.1 zinc metallopeptidase [Clostridium sp.]